MVVVGVVVVAEWLWQSPFSNQALARGKGPCAVEATIVEGNFRFAKREETTIGVCRLMPMLCSCV